MQLKLTEEEKIRLKQLHRLTKDGRSRDKIKSILMLSEGYSSQEISKILLIDNNTVTNWKKTFTSRASIENWFHYSYSSYNGKLSKEEEGFLIDFIENNFIISSNQVIEYIKSHFEKEYTSSGILPLLHRLGFVYKQTTLIPSKYDPKLQKEFKTKYEELKRELKDDETILFMDGVHPQHNTTTSKAWIKKGKEKHIKSNTGRSRINLNGIYNPSTQDILVHQSDRINAESTIEFFKEIEDYYKGKKKIHIIVDNAKYYKNKAVKKYVEDSRIEMIFLPPYSPNLNLIERLWKLLRKKVISNHYYDSFKKFRDAVLGFFDKSDKMKDEIEKFIGNKLHLIETV